MSKGRGGEGVRHACTDEQGKLNLRPPFGYPLVTERLFPCHARYTGNADNVISESDALATTRLKLYVLTAC